MPQIFQTLDSTLIPILNFQEGHNILNLTCVPHGCQCSCTSNISLNCDENRRRSSLLKICTHIVLCYEESKCHKHFEI